MNVLLLTQIVPYPPDSGPKVKTYHVLHYLAERGHRVTLAAFVRPHEVPSLANVRPYCAELYSVPLRRSHAADLRALAQSLTSGLPFLVTRDAQQGMQDLMQQLATRPFDVVHADQLTMAQFALRFRAAASRSGRPSPCLVFDAHNAVWEIVGRAAQTASPWLRPLLGVEASRIKQYEGALVHSFDHTLAVSETDRQALLSAGEALPDSQTRPQPAISVIPIAVAADQLVPQPQALDSQEILTLGTLFYPPNADGVRWFMHRVFPSVLRQVPGATLTVVGPRPPRDLLEFEARSAGRVNVAGYVPDLDPYFRRAAVLVVPVRAASGMRVRILEALARGAAVVTTSTGAEGIEVVNGEHLLMVDEPEEFAAAVVKLLGDPAMRQRLGANGRALVKAKYDWQVVLPDLEAVYQSLVHN